MAACLGLSVAQVPAPGLSGGDEFTGPFPSWANAKSYGAVGDGIADDTVALQNVLNILGRPGNPFVLYLPAGSYRITAGLTLNSPRQGISIVGQDPATTIVKWDGPVGGEMLYLNGVSLSKLSRITWDGAGTRGNQALTAIDYGWDGLGTFGGGTYNENSDEVFQNVGYGIRGGSKGFMDAENAVLRCRFNGATRAGISIENYNALDWYIWDSTFTNNVIGITNNQNGSGGHFHVYGSLFQGSTVADIQIGPTSYFSIRQNFSIGSNAFFTVQSTGSASADLTFQSNIVLDAATTPIAIHNPGAVLMFDNTIRMKAGQTGPAVTVQDTQSGSPADFVALGNSIGYSGTVASWYSVPAGAGNTPGNIVDLDNQITVSATITPATPAMPGAPPNNSRTVFEVPAPSNADAIQKAIDAAVALNGSRPVVHLPPGAYSIDHSVVIPVGSDLQLVGDGGGSNAATTLQWVGSGTGPALRVAGPSRAAFRDFNVQGTGPSTGIVVENIDQSSGRVFLDQMNTILQTGTGLFVNGLDNAEVMLHNSYVQDNNTGIQVTGGPKAAAGQTVTAKTDSFAALTASNTLTYNVSNHGRLMSQDVWYEGAPTQLVNLTDSGTFTLHGAEIGAQDPNHGGVQSSTPTFQVNGFNGSISVLAAQLAIRNTIAAHGNGANTNLLALGILGPTDNANFFSDTTSPAGQVGMFASRQATNTGSIPVADVIHNITPAAFIRQMTAQTRQEQAHPLTVPAPGNTDVRFYRVSVSQGQTGIELDAGGPSSTAAPTISGVASAVNNTSATITWTTNEAADSRVQYGTTSSYGSLSPLNNSFTTSHSVTLSGLLAGTQYHYAVLSRSYSGYSSVSADFIFTTPGTSTPVNFVTGFTPGTLRNNFTGWIGMKFTTGASVPIVTSLGRIFVAGNTGTHALKIVRASDGGDVPGASVSISMTGGVGGAFTYTQLASPVSLAANTSYYLVSQETLGGDQWYDISPVTTTAIGTVNGPEYLSNAWVLAPPKNNSYVPLDFKYVIAPSDTVPPTVAILAPAAGASVQGNSVVVSATAGDDTGVVSVQFKVDGNNIGSPSFAVPYSTTWATTSFANGAHVLTAVASDAAGNTTVSAPVTVTVANAGSGLPLITGFNLNTLRNGFSGWVGMQFTVGSSPITVSTLGRLYIAGNTGSHVVKLVRVSDKSDVPGASVTIALPSGPAGQFAYVPLPNPVTLPAGSAYYLVSQETAGGDQWYDGGAITAANVAAANGQVYYAGQWVLVPNTTNASYVPANLLYTVTGNSPPTVTLTSPAQNATLTGNATLSASATPAGGATIASVQFKVDNADQGAPVTTSPYNLIFDTTKLSAGTHSFTALATDSNGATAISSPVTAIVSNVVPPSVAIIAPANNATVTGSITLTATVAASSGLTIASVQFKVDGSPAGAPLTIAPFTAALDTSAYASGAHVLTAVATDSNGNSTISAPVNFTTSNSNAPAPFILSQNTPLPAVRNNFTGFLGLQFTTGAIPPRVFALGRLYLSGNLASHTLKLVKASDGSDVPGASASVIGGTPGQFSYGQLASPVTLAANTAYYLLSQENSGGDQWYDYGPLSYNGIAFINGPAYSNGLGGYTAPNNPNNGFVPVNLLYTNPSAATTAAITAPAANAMVSGTVTLSANVTPGFGLTTTSVQFQVDGTNQGAPVAFAPYATALDTTKLFNGVHTVAAIAKDSGGTSTPSAPVSFSVANQGAASPLLTGSPTGSPRNNYTGWVGMQFTVGSNPISVTSLGRAYLTGNTGTHAVKLVRAADGGDVPGGSVSLALPAGVAGQYAYAPLANAVTLAANTGYVLVSQEILGGDQWYDAGPVTPSKVAVVNTAVYWDGSIYFPLGVPNNSYVPVNLLYTQGPAVSITAPLAGAIVSGSSVTVSASTGSNITSVQFKVDGANQGAPVTVSPYSIVLDSTKLTNGPHTLTAVGADAFNNPAPSAPVAITVANLPAVSITAPAAGATVSGNTTVSASATAALGATIASVQFQVDGANQGGAATTSPYSIVVDTSKLTKGAHTLTAIATDSFNNSATSAPVGITIGGSTPTVSITAPANGAPVSGTNVTVLATASPGTGATIASVQFKVDGVNQGAAVAASPYSIVLDTTKLTYGAHTLTAMATDSANTSTTSLPVSITVSNPPTVNITSPAAGATVSGNVTVTATATAVAGASIANVQFKLDGNNQGAPVTTAPYSSVLDTSKLAAGAHTLTAAATDSLNNPATSAPVAFTVGSGAPPPSTPFVTSFIPATLRNNFSGWVGLQFAVGSPQLNVSSLGRIFVAGNTGSHIVKLVRASDGSDVPGASVTISSSGTAGQFTYVPLGALVTLTPNSSYYLVSQETAGGDQWYDISPVATTNAATVSGPVYWNGFTWVPIASPNSGYVPLNLQYTTATAPAVSITAPAAGVTVSGNNVAVSATATAASGLTIASVQFKVDNVNQGAAVATSPYGVVLDATKLINGPHTLTAAATDSAGTTATSAPITITAANPAPTVSIAAPTAGATLAGNNVTLSATAAAGNGLTISSVQFKVDNINQGAAVTASPYSIVLDSTKLANGSHSITAVATDSAGNSTTSAPVNVTVSNAAPPSGTALVSGFTQGSLRNNFSGWVGMKFTVGSTALTVTALGRIYLAGNTGSHVVKLARASDGTDVPGGSVTVQLPSGAAGQFAYAQLAAPVTLTANTTYYLASQEVAGGDQWGDYAPVTTTNAASVPGPVYWNGSAWIYVAGANSSFVPVNLQYSSSVAAPVVSITAPAPSATVSGNNVTVTASASAGTGLTIANVQFKVDNVNLGAPFTASPYTIVLDATKLANGSHSLTAVATDSASNSTSSSPITITVTGNTSTAAPLITSVAPGGARNNFTGPIGMQFTVGSSALSVTALGRIYVPGNTGSHLVKLVRSDGTDVPGGSATISPSSGTAGQFTYAQLASPVTLAANSVYFLVSQETSGGDQWYDIGPVTTGAAAAVNGPVYWNGFTYFLVKSPNTSYVPLNLQYAGP